MNIGLKSFRHVIGCFALGKILQFRRSLAAVERALLQKNLVRINAWGALARMRVPSHICEDIGPGRKRATESKNSIGASFSREVGTYDLCVTTR
jgi:hypothetical protein